MTEAEWHSRADAMGGSCVHVPVIGLKHSAEFHTCSPSSPPAIYSMPAMTDAEWAKRADAIGGNCVHVPVAGLNHSAELHTCSPCSPPTMYSSPARADAEWPPERARDIGGNGFHVPVRGLKHSTELAPLAPSRRNVFAPPAMYSSFGHKREYKQTLSRKSLATGCNEDITSDPNSVCITCPIASTDEKTDVAVTSHSYCDSWHSTSNLRRCSRAENVSARSTPRSNRISRKTCTSCCNSRSCSTTHLKSEPDMQIPTQCLIELSILKAARF